MNKNGFEKVQGHPMTVFLGKYYDGFFHKILSIGCFEQLTSCIISVLHSQAKLHSQGSNSGTNHHDSDSLFPLCNLSNIYRWIYSQDFRLNY